MLPVQLYPKGLALHIFHLLQCQLSSSQRQWVRIPDEGDGYDVFDIIGREKTSVKFFNLNMKTKLRIEKKTNNKRFMSALFLPLGSCLWRIR